MTFINPLTLVSLCEAVKHIVFVDYLIAMMPAVSLHRMAGSTMLFRKPVCKSLWLTLTTNGIAKKRPTRKSRRGGTKLRRPITTVSVSRCVTQGTNKLQCTCKSRRCGANVYNLQQVTLTQHDPSFTRKPAIVALLNVRSIRNKSPFITDYVLEHDIDILCLTETWLSTDDDLLVTSITPDGYTFHHVPRQTGSARRRSLHYVEDVVLCCSA